SGPWQLLPRNIVRARQGPDFFVHGNDAGQTPRTERGDDSGEVPPPAAICPSMTGLLRASSRHWLKESVMGVIAWIVLGLVAGLLANMLIPGRRSQGLILTCVIGVLGALGGGWVATRVFHIHTLHGFFNLSTWLTAIAAAAVLRLISHLIGAGSTGPSRSRRRSGLFAHR